jgi:hypothetical protein
LRHRWRDGTTHIVLDSIELIEKLAALVPPPRAHQLRISRHPGPRRQSARRSGACPTD